MTPRRLDWDVVQRRLHLMEESLSDLDLLAAGIAATLDAYPTYIAQVSAYVLAQQTDAP
jgi:hypothetical protein